MYLGIDQTTEMVFEGNYQHNAYIVWPSPLLTPAKFISASSREIVPEQMETATYLFREDAFDPVTRIRRGRFYKKTPTQPDRWRVTAVQPAANVILHEKTAFTFQSCHVSEIVFTPDAGQQLVILGTLDASSLWTIVNRESIHTREVVVTLKARQSFGVLPEIDWGLVPDTSGLVKEKLDSLVDDVYRAGSESVVDRAREAATAILSAYLQSKGVAKASGKDLGALTDLLDERNGKHEQRIVRCAAEIPQRLHSRAKHAEQEKHDDLRPIREQDAELAVQCIGVMLCDLCWAKWN